METWCPNCRRNIADPASDKSLPGFPQIVGLWNRGLCYRCGTPLQSNERSTPPRHPDEDPSIYGWLCKDLRKSIRRSTGIVNCGKCASSMRIDLVSIENEIRRDAAKQKSLESGGVAYLKATDWSRGAVCRGCETLFCPQCVKEAIQDKKVTAQLTRAFLFYIPSHSSREAVEIDLLSSSIMLCPKCNADLLAGIDHITD